MPTSTWTQNSAALLGAILAVLVTFLLLGWIARRVFLSLERTEALAKAAPALKVLRQNVRVLLSLALLVSCLAVAGWGGWLWYRGEVLTTWARARVQEIPPGFWTALAVAGAKSVGLALAAWFGLRLVRRALRAACEKAKAYEGVRANDESIERFFGSLARIVTRATWLGVLAWSARAFGLPQQAYGSLIVALRVYLILSVGLLVWRAVDALIASLDALSKKYSSPDNLLRHYDRFSTLVPLFRRTVEYVLIVFVVTLALKEIEWVANLAELGPRIIASIGIVFLSRVVVEVLNLTIDELLVKRAQLTHPQRQRRQTIVPLIESIAKYIIYFNAAIMILRQLGVDPTPFLAGAGIIGLAVGLGAQNLVNDMVSGFFILFEDYFLVGDFVEIGGAAGVVERIDLRTTRIRDSDGRHHIVRNGQIDGVVNYSKAYTFAVVEVGVSYETDLDAAYEALQAAGERLREQSSDVLEPTVVRGLVAFGESELTLRTITKVKPGAHLEVERRLRKTIKEVFDERGIEIPYARRVLILQNPEALHTAPAAD